MNPRPYLSAPTRSDKEHADKITATRFPGGKLTRAREWHNCDSPGCDVGIRPGETYYSTGVSTRRPSRNSRDGYSYSSIRACLCCLESFD